MQFDHDYGISGSIGIGHKSPSLSFGAVTSELLYSGNGSNCIWRHPRRP